MVNAIVQLFGSRKFLVMLFAQIAIAAPAYFKVITPELAAELGSLVAAAWMASHAVQEKGTPPGAGPALVLLFALTFSASACTGAEKTGVRTALDLLARYCGADLTLKECGDVVLNAFPSADGGRP